MLSLSAFAPGRHYVIECSSYQIDLAPSVDPTVGILLNVTPDHLDRHGTIENYAAVKARLVRRSRNAVVGIDDRYCRAIADSCATAARRPTVGHAPFHAPGADCDIGVEGTRIVLHDGKQDQSPTSPASARCAGRTTPRMPARPPPRCCCCPIRSRRNRSPRGCARFPGLRTAWRSSAGGAARCSSTIQRRRTLIPPRRRSRRFPATSIGSSAAEPKAGGIASLQPLFPRVAKAYLIGEATEEFAATFEGQRRIRALRYARQRRRGRCARRRPRAAQRSRWCCCRPRAPRSTSTATSRCAATPSVRPSRRCPASRSRGDDMRVSRADRSRIAEWWFTVDHVLLGAILAIVGAGLVFSLAASPAVAIRKGLPTYYFVERHFLFSIAGVLIMLFVSLLSPRAVRRLALVLLGVAVAGMIAVHFVGPPINGARRWLSIGGHSFQPSEFAKPAFVVLSAWLFAESQARSDMPALSLSILMAGCSGGAVAVGARRRPDPAHLDRVGIAFLPLGPAVAGGGRRRDVRRTGLCLCLLDLRSRAHARRHVPLIGAQRQLAGRSRDEVVLRGRLPWARAGRRHDQDGASRRTHRFHFRRDRRGIRRRRLPDTSGDVRLRRHARAHQGRAGARAPRRGSPSRDWRSCSGCRR